MGYIGEPIKIHDEPHPIKAPLITPVRPIVEPVIAPEPLRTPELVPVRRI